MANIDWDRVAKGVARENKKMIWRPYGIPTVMDLEHLLSRCSDLRAVDGHPGTADHCVLNRPGVLRSD